MNTKSVIVRHPLGYKPKMSNEEKEFKLEIKEALENNKKRIREIDEMLLGSK